MYAPTGRPLGDSPRLNRIALDRILPENGRGSHRPAPGASRVLPDPRLEENELTITLTFWIRSIFWTGILLAILLTVSLLSGQAWREVLAHLPAWTGLALALAAFPAGLGTSRLTFPDDRLVMRSLVAFGLAAASISVLLFALENLVGPAATRALGTTAHTESQLEPAAMSLGELKRAAGRAVETARAAEGAHTIARWQAANRLVWHHVRRTDGALLPLFFAVTGVMAGYWIGRFRRAEVRQAQSWALGLFLLVTTYLAGENSYELIVLRSAGPVFFAGDLVLVIPGLLGLGLGWTTLVALWTEERHGRLEPADR